MDLRLKTSKNKLAQNEIMVCELDRTKTQKENPPGGAHVLKKINIPISRYFPDFKATWEPPHCGFRDLDKFSGCVQWREIRQKTNK